MGSAELMLILGLLLAGVAVFLFVSSIFASNSDKQQLSWANNDEPVKSKNPVINFSRPLVHQFTLQHAMKIRSESYRKKVSRYIKTSGLSSELNEDEFIGLQLLWGIIFPIFLMIMNFSLQLGLSIPVVIGMGLIGFYLPQIHAKGEKKRRELSVRADLPFFIDLLALSVEAGLDFFSAIQKIVDKARGTDSVLADEFSIVLKDIKIGSSKSQALKEMAERLDMNEITSFVAVLVDAEATGASISQVLKDQSVQMRLERFVRAEKAGAQASQLILLPLMLFILPAVFIVVFGPVAVSFMYGGK
ncbi:type II secretion system F family protein [Bdellovibrio bacteriovorus]|uniref:type II secretion system F family protein n=1 Tax=Bdellovibrio bacteriovorus TaxID=959 RepID=UPI0021D34734|nr:type II secretion system F family protein [Bdellovibrio bacteriovorus]UXR64973.1 type II secretion system F family protein [Bdellovibrio bacteriovorus]